MSDAIDSIQTMMSRHSRDWAADHRDAWIWGIVQGWPPDAMKEVAEKHGWSDEDVVRLRRLHREFHSRSFKPCPSCGGSGKDTWGMVCMECEGQNTLFADL